MIDFNFVYNHVQETYCPDNGIKSRCYCFEELFAEKIRALAERERPRDLYDVVHLYRHEELASDQTIILSTLEKKCAFKEISVPTMETFRNRPEREELEAEWENMLAHQLPALPSFEQFWVELPEVMKWLYGVVEKVKKEAISLVGGEKVGYIKKIADNSISIYVNGYSIIFCCPSSR